MAIDNCFSRSAFIFALLGLGISIAEADVVNTAIDVPGLSAVNNKEVSKDQNIENVVGEASYNIENCDDAPEDTEDDSKEDADSSTEPKDFDECKPIVK